MRVPYVIFGTRDFENPKNIKDFTCKNELENFRIKNLYRVAVPSGTRGTAKGLNQANKSDSSASSLYDTWNADKYTIVLEKWKVLIL